MIPDYRTKENERIRLLRERLKTKMTSADLKEKQTYLIPFNFRAPLIFAQLKRAKNERARKWPIFAHDGARKLKGAN